MENHIERFNLEEGVVVVSLPPNLSLESYLFVEEHFGLLLKRLKRRTTERPTTDQGGEK